MNALTWIKMLRSKFLGKKENTPAAGEHAGGLEIVTPIALIKNEGSLVLDGLGVIQLPEHWRN